MTRSWRQHVLVCLIVLTFSAPAIAAPVPVSDEWSDVARIEAGKKIVVVPHNGMGQKLRGEFVSSDADGITVRTASGEEKILAWQSVRKIKPKRKWTGFWVGLATGASIAAVSVVAPGAGVGAAWKAGFIGIGAGSLGAVGASLDAKRQPAIYQAPEGERRR